MSDINIYYVDMLAFCFISSIWFTSAFWVLPLFSWFYVNSKHALGCRHTDSFSSPAVQLLVICTIHLMPVRNKLSGCSPAVFARLFWLPIQQDYTRANKNADNWCLHVQRFIRSRSWTTCMKQGDGFYWWIASTAENYYENTTPLQSRPLCFCPLGALSQQRKQMWCLGWF